MDGGSKEILRESEKDAAFSLFAKHAAEHKCAQPVLRRCCVAFYKQEVAIADDCGRHMHENKATKQSWSPPNPFASSRQSFCTKATMEEDSFLASIDRLSKFTEVELSEQISESNRGVVVWHLLQACIGANEQQLYDARLRASLRQLSVALGLPVAAAYQLELALASDLAGKLKHDTKKQGEAQANEKLPWWKRSRTWAVAGATATGGVVCALTGGLAAPAVAASLHSLFGFSVGAGTLTGGFSIYGASEAAKRTNKLTSDLNVFEFRKLDDDDGSQPPKLSVTIFASGIVKHDDDYVQHWKDLQWHWSDAQALVFEPEVLTRLSDCFERAISDAVVNKAITTGLAQTFVRSLMVAAAAPAALIGAMGWIDNTITTVASKADKAGDELAHALKSGIHSGRPVSFVAFGYGARAIMTCLYTLAKGGYYGIVDSVYLAGLPWGKRSNDWSAARNVCSGRVVSCYSSSDWLLGISFRSTALHKGCAGLQPVDHEGVESINIRDLVSRHSDYAQNATLREIIERIEAGGSVLDTDDAPEDIAGDEALPEDTSNTAPAAVEEHANDGSQTTTASQQHDAETVDAA